MTMTDVNYSRRGFIRAVGLGAAVAAVPQTLLAGERGERRPNVVLIVSATILPAKIFILCASLPRNLWVFSSVT